MKLSLIVLLAVPTLAFAAKKQLPNPKILQQICFTRAYSAEHMKKNPKQKINGVAVTLERLDDGGIVYSSLHVSNLESKILSSGGAVLDKLPAVSVRAQMDGDGGRYEIIQDAKNKDKIKVKIIDQVTLAEDNWMSNDSIPEGTPYEEMSIAPNSVDSVMILERQHSNGSAKSCEEILEDYVHSEQT